jgi:hypothetical protein
MPIAQPRRRMRTLFVSTACALVLAGSSRPAAAIDRHERAKLSPLREKKKTVGVKVKMTLYPEIYGRVRIGIGSAGKLPSPAASYTDKRALAAGVKKGYIRHKVAELKQLALGKPKEVEYEVRFTKANGLRPGQEIDLVTAWIATPSGTSGYWHVFGMKNGPVQSGPTLKIPK